MNPKNKASKVRLLILDVDGILTSGMLYYSEQQTEIKAFHIHDGLGIKLLQQSGIPVAIISGKSSAALQRRVNDLNIEHCYLNYEDKLPAYQDIQQQLKLTDEEIAYMGDDLPDLPLLQKSGFAITVPQAPSIIKDNADLITAKKGGKGAVREACEYILESQDQLQTVLQSYHLKI